MDNLTSPLQKINKYFFGLLLQKIVDMIFFCILPNHTNAVFNNVDFLGK